MYKCLYDTDLELQNRNFNCINCFNVLPTCLHVLNGFTTENALPKCHGLWELARSSLRLNRLFPGICAISRSASN